MGESNWKGVGEREFPAEEGSGKPWVSQAFDISHPAHVKKPPSGGFFDYAIMASLLRNFKQMKKYFYLNGKVLPIDRPALQINDIGILRGYGVFDFMRTQNGKIFHWDDHFKRFTNSAKTLNLKVPLSKASLAVAIGELSKKNHCQKDDFSVRLVLTGGPTEDGLSYKKPSFAILLEDIYDFPKTCYQDGAKLISLDYERLLPESKNNNYIWTVKLGALKKQKGAVDLLYVAKGKVLEASMANLFLFKGATLITPKDGVLKGITRKIVLKLAKHHFKIEERDVKIGELESATEVFLSSTNKLIMPIVNIDGKKIGGGKVGENTKKIIELYENYANNY